MRVLNRSDDGTPVSVDMIWMKEVCDSQGTAAVLLRTEALNHETVDTKSEPVNS